MNADKVEKSEKSEKKTWHGIPREAIPWLPTVDADAYIGFQLCYITCSRAVYDMHDSVAVAAMECVVGCSTCGNVCPTGAITFPNLDSVWKMEREHQIFRTVKKEALCVNEREDALEGSPWAQEAVAQVSTRAKVEVAGEFGVKHFRCGSEELIEGKPFDIVNLKPRSADRQGRVPEGTVFHELRGHFRAAGGHCALPRRGEEDGARRRPGACVCNAGGLTIESCRGARLISDPDAPLIDVVRPTRDASANLRAAVRGHTRCSGRARRHHDGCRSRFPMTWQRRTATGSRVCSSACSASRTCRPAGWCGHRSAEAAAARR